VVRQHTNETKRALWDDIAESSRQSVWYKLLLLQEGGLETMYHACAAAASMLSQLSALSWTQAAGQPTGSAADSQPFGAAASSTAGAAGAPQPPDGESVVDMPLDTPPEAGSPGVGAGLRQRGAAFAYVPEFFLSSLVDAFNTLALRRLGDSVFVQLTDERHLASLRVILQFLMDHFNARSIISADTRDTVIQTIGSVLHNADFVRVIEDLPARFNFMRLLISSFDAHCWLPVTNILLRLCRGTGFGDTKHPSAASMKTASPALQGAFAEVATQSPDLRSEFINQVLDHLNWTMTEFGLALSEVDGGRGPSQLLRKVAIMFELSVNLLQLIEFCANRSGSAARAIACAGASWHVRLGWWCVHAPRVSVHVLYVCRLPGMFVGSSSSVSVRETARAQLIKNARLN
jgi:hypothetical protein